MNSLIEIISNHVPNSNFTAAFLDASIKSFAILALAGGVCLCWRRASAATRHLIWFLAVACLPCLPLISSMLPSWKKPLWSVSTSLNSGNHFSLTLELAGGTESGFSRHQTPTSATKTATAAVGGGQSGRAQRVGTQFNAGSLVLALSAWASGILLALSSVGVAGRGMCIARGRACDDLVVNSGCKGSAYASHLVELAGSFRRVPRAAAIAMARPSGLERRITAILDGRRNRDRIAKIASVFIVLALLGVEFLIGANTVKSSPEAWSLERSDVANQLKRFVAEKEAQAIAGAKAEGKAMLPEFKSLFAAAGKGDWLIISNIWEDLRTRAPQYDGSGPKDMQLHGTAWSTVLPKFSRRNAWM